jgi:HK97 family phage major capsid protein/HK97 family phage prohead protease
MLEALEVRFTPTVDADAGTFSGTASAYGVMDSYRTEFVTGSFARSLEEHRAAGTSPPMLWGHDPDRPVGVWTEIKEDATGLHVRGRLILETVAGREAHALMKAGAVTGLSVGFLRRKDEARAGGGRRITDADLGEISLVTLPSNHKARITEVRASNPWDSKGVTPAARAATTKEGRMDPEDENGAAPEDGTKTPETRADTTMETRMAALEKDLKEERARADRLEARMGRIGLAGSNDNATDREYRAIASFARTGDHGAFSEVRAMWTGSDPEGGYLILPEVSTTIQKRVHDETAMRTLCRTETITKGDEWVEPWDLDDLDATWVGERESRPTTSTLDIDMLRVPLREIYANVPVTQRMLDDSGINLGAWLEGKIADKFVRAEGAAFISDANTPKRPAGLFSYPTAATADATRAWGTMQFVKSGAASAITADGLKNLVWSLRKPYRKGATFLLNSNTANALDQLKDSQGQYIWRTGMTAGAPNSLLGYPVEFDESMPDIAANAMPIAFGDFKRGYLIVDKLGLRFVRDNLTDKPNTLFYAYKRVGAGLANSEAIKFQKIAA